MTPSTPKHAFHGLTDEEVAENRRLYGKNLITPPDRDPWWALFLEKFDDPVIRILLIAAGLAIAAGTVHGDYIEGTGIIVAVLLATGLAFINELKASKEFDVLNQVNDSVPIRAFRNGQLVTVPRLDLVVGDIVMIEAGEEVPVDGDLLQAVGLQVNESGLTGESEACKKVPRNEDVPESEVEAAFPRYVVLRGSMVADGHGILATTHVGDNTEIGKSSRAAADNTGDKSPLDHQLEGLSKLIGVVGLAIAAATFGALVVRGAISGEISLTANQWLVAMISFSSVAATLSPVWLPMVSDGVELFAGRPLPPWLTGGDDDTPVPRAKSLGIPVAIGIIIAAAGLGGMWSTGALAGPPTTWLPAEALTDFLGFFMIAVTIIVVAVPEGLAMSVTLSLAYSMRKMTAANTLVRKLHACETIGAATVICSDKTGTLTRNEMSVYESVFGGATRKSLDHAPSLRATIAEAISTNSTAHLGAGTDDLVKPIGNPTEAALLQWLKNSGVDYLEIRSAFSTDQQLSFSTDRKYMATLGVSPASKLKVLHIKGAPELVLNMCTDQESEQGVCPLSDEARAKVHEQLLGFQSRGMRTLGFAFGVTSSEDTLDLTSYSPSKLTWIGFAAIADPVRSDVPDAIKLCRRAGIDVKMVTGDNAQTAQEIGRQIGIWDEACSGSQHLGGSTFNDLDDDAAKKAAPALRILSRAKPMDKVRLVRSLQAAGEVVAVTGDGINDCGALNYADVGLAMGNTGKAAAKEASDIILLDDSFSTIVNAVMWGRSLYDNIQRFILFQLTINVAALAIALIGPFIGVSLPLTVTQMLWINLIMDTFAALALATEPPHRDVLNRPPRSPNAFIVSKSMATNIFTMAAIFISILLGMLLWMQRDGAVDENELSIFFTVFVMLQFWNMFNARCFGTTRSAFTGFWENRSFALIAASIFVGQIIIVQLGGSIFRTKPLSVTLWCGIIGCTSLVLMWGEFQRLLLRRSSSSQP